MLPQIFNKTKLEYIIIPEDLLKNISEAVIESMGISIVTDAHVDKAAFYIKKYKQLKKEIETLRKEDVDELNGRVRAINADYKAIINAFEFEPERLGSELTDYMRKKRELEEIERKKEQAELDDALIKEAEIFNDESVLDVESKVEIRREKLHTEHLTTMRVKRWRIVDENKVPRKYLLLNDALITRIRKAGEFDAVSDIDGIEFFTDEVARA